MHHPLLSKSKPSLLAVLFRTWMIEVPLLRPKIYDHQHHMGLLMLEKKELASKYEQVKTLAESSELMHKHDSAMNKSALTESRKREESLKKIVGVKDACIASLEKALHEMRTECTETKVAAKSKFAEAHQLIDEAQKKFTEAEAKVCAAESLQGEANRYNSVAERKIRDVEAREDNLRKQIISFKSEFHSMASLFFGLVCDEKDKEMNLERQSLCERQKGLQQEQERLLQSQAFQKELEDTKVKIEKEREALHDERTTLKLKEATLMKQEEEAALRTQKHNLEVELQMQRKLVENEIVTKRRAWELKEVDLKQHEDQILERENALEVLSRSLNEKDKDLVDLSSALEEKDQRLTTAEKELELNMALVQREKDDIEQEKHDLQNETGELSILEVKLKEEIDLVRSQKLDLLAEADMLKAEKAKFEAEWELFDEKKEELRREAEFIAKERQAVSTFIKNEHDQLREEKENLCKQYTQDLGLLASEREKFMNKMAHEHAEWYGKMQQERADFLRDIEMQRQELKNLIEKRREEVESYLKGRENAFEEKKNAELQYINALKEKAAKELQQVQRDKLQKQRELLHTDRVEIYAQTEELKKLKDLRALSDDIAFTMESNQKKISVWKNLKHQTLTQGGDNISNRFNTPVVPKSSVSPPSPVQFSWIKRCTELIFRSKEDSLLVSDTEPKVIVEVPSQDEAASQKSEFESQTKDLNGKSALLFSEEHVGRRKRGRGNLTNIVGDPVVDPEKNKKSRAEELKTENPLDKGTACCMISTQPDVSDVQMLMSSNQTQRSAGETQGRYLPFSSSAPGSKEEISKGNNEQVSEHAENYIDQFHPLPLQDFSFVG
ncbi:hypothetical protein RJT34_17188 [Clitoria ternatea]|uniref:Uncharacterized protein n=1 Tax=Clitoria ternatea TaxID=43366 RepID=A0AAN9JA41_CLITE